MNNMTSNPHYVVFHDVSLCVSLSSSKENCISHFEKEFLVLATSSAAMAYDSSQEYNFWLKTWELCEMKMRKKKGHQFY